MITGKGETEVELLPGQFIFGRKTAARSMKMKESTIRNRIEKLKKLEKIDIKSDTHYSIITIRNWETYQPCNNEVGQAIGQPKDNQRTTKGHKQEGIKLKEGKEEKKNTYFVEFKPDFIPADLWKELIESRKKKKLQNTQLALKTFCNSLKKAIGEGYTIEDCIGQYVSSKWDRFNVEWMANSGVDPGENGGGRKWVVKE